MTPDSLLRVVAVQTDEHAVLEAAVGVTGELLADGAAFAALPTPKGFRVSISSGSHDPRTADIVCVPGVGLGGYVLSTGTMTILGDYATDPRISKEFVDIVSGGEGLHGMSCIPVIVNGRTEALLYGALRCTGTIGGRAAERLELAAEAAAIGIAQVHERRRCLELQRLRDRERLATMLHDSVAQLLFGIGVAASQSLLTRDPTILESAMREIELTAASARRELRDTLEGLADCDEGLALEARLQAELRLFSQRTGCRTRLARSGSPRPLSDRAGELVVDVVLEGMRNAVKHAGATFALAYIDYEERSVKVAIQSEMAEPGRVAELHASAGTCHGLQTLAQRARGLGGSLDLVDGEGGLRVLRLLVPTAC